MKRTEEQAVSMAPIEVVLGAEKYSIRLLNINPQREWRTKLHNALFPILDSFQAPTLQKALEGGLTSALLKFPDAIMDLVFEYAPYLPKDKIMEEATEEQMACAFSEIQSVAYPYLPQLTTATQLWRQARAGSILSR